MDNLINKIIDENKYQKINDNIILTKHQIDILNKNNIPFNNLHDLKELLFLLDDEEDEELMAIAEEISDFYYYHFTNK